VIIKQGEDHKRVPKKDAIFRLRLECREVEVEGTALYGRPEDRVKKKIKKRW
jgi:RNase P/RNase MRP subunit p29